jgi:hypothetical protein
MRAAGRRPLVVTTASGRAYSSSAVIRRGNGTLAPITVYAQREVVYDPIDVFGPDFDADLLAAALSAHHELLPFDSTQALSVALDRATKDVLGTNHSLVGLASRAVAQWGNAPLTESLLLHLRKAFPEHAGEILKRTQEYYASAS